MQKLSKWTVDEDGLGVYRAMAGTDGNVIANRVAFIEKTPRVRIRSYSLGTEKHWDDAGNVVSEERRWPEFLDWFCGDKGDGPDDPESRQWCDKILTAMGYELEN
jgi:hypothetical protein